MERWQSWSRAAALSERSVRESRCTICTLPNPCLRHGATQETSSVRESRRRLRGQKVRSKSIPAQAMLRKNDGSELREFDPDETLEDREDRFDVQVRRERRGIVRSLGGRTRVSLPDCSIRSPDLSRFEEDSHQNSSAASSSSDQASSNAARSTEDAPNGRCKICTLPNPCRRHTNPMVNGSLSTQVKDKRKPMRRQSLVPELNSSAKSEATRIPRSKSTSAIPSKSAVSQKSDLNDTNWDTCTICFGEFTADDPPASQADPLRHGIKFTCPHSAAFHLSCLQQEAQQVRIFHCPLCRAKFGFSAFCICGSELVEMKADDPNVYGGNGVRCDHCCANVPGNHLVYHCPRAKSDMHPNGYDVCCKCAGKELPKEEQPSETEASTDTSASNRRNRTPLDVVREHFRQERERENMGNARLQALASADSTQEWECPACTLLNEASSAECAACGGIRPSLLQAAMTAMSPGEAAVEADELENLLQRLSTLHMEHREMQRILANAASQTETMRSLEAAMVASASDEVEPDPGRGTLF